MSNEPLGILNINKPTGWTSHDVVARVRRILGTRRVGHTGTLDPLATGVLVICVGKATRVAEYLTTSEKQYRAGIRLGISTDTYDTDGRTTSQHPVPDLSQTELAQALSRFVGETEQIPPVYSAIKKDGVPLHRLARRGQALSAPPRTVSIYDISLLDWQSPMVSVDVTCGSGTYIRSLAHDLGQVLGCGATLASLERLRSGSFTVEDAITLDDLASAVESGHLDRHLHPVRSALTELAPVQVDEQNTERLSHGLPIPCPIPPTTHIGYAVGPDHEVVAILAYDARGRQWRPRKVLISNN